jgi:hypothetical protein
MAHSNRMLPYLLGVAAIAAVLMAVGAPFASLLPFAVVLACPLMMVFMMKGMSGAHGGGEGHAGHGCEHGPARRSDPPTSTVL